MPVRRWRWLLVVVVLAGCGLVPNDPMPEPIPGLVKGGRVLSACEPPLAFEGETTIAELGLVDAIPGVGDDAMQRGLIQITRDPIPWEEFAPPDVPPAIDAGQMLCATWNDGSSMSTLLHRPFRAAGDGPTVEPVDIPFGPIVVGVVVLLVIAASWLLFRRAAPPAS